MILVLLQSGGARLEPLAPNLPPARPPTHPPPNAPASRPPLPPPRPRAAPLRPPPRAGHRRVQTAPQAPPARPRGASAGAPAHGRAPRPCVCAWWVGGGAAGQGAGAVVCSCGCTCRLHAEEGWRKAPQAPSPDGPCRRRTGRAARRPPCRRGPPPSALPPGLLPEERPRGKTCVSGLHRTSHYARLPLDAAPLQQIMPPRLARLRRSTPPPPGPAPPTWPPHRCGLLLPQPRRQRALVALLRLCGGQLRAQASQRVGCGRVLGQHTLS